MWKQARVSLALLLAILTAAPSRAAVQLDRKPTQLNVMVESGGNLTNEVRSRRPVDLVVRVTDEAGNPVPNAIVTVLLPTTGAGLQSPTGSSSVTAQTDDEGRVRFFGLIPFGTGQFTVRIVAAYAGVTGTATITQTNVAGAFMTPTKWAIVGAAAAAAAGVGLGLYFSQRDNGPTTITLGPGSVRPVGAATVRLGGVR